MRTAHTNTKQWFTTHSDKLVALELQYRIKASIGNALSCQDRPKQVAVTMQDKGKDPGEKRAYSAFKILQKEKSVILNTTFNNHAQLGECEIMFTSSAHSGNFISIHSA